MKRMEERLLRHVPKEEVSSVLATTGRSAVKPSATASGKKRTATTAFEGSEDLWASTTHTPKKVLVEGSSGGAMPGRPKESVDSENGANVLPRQDVQEHLAEAFFDFLYGQPFLLLHRASFMRQLR